MAGEMNNVSKRLQAVKGSETLAIKARASELAAQGKSIIDLSVGEPDIDTPQHIKDAALDAMKRGATKYTAAQGIEPLREAIAQKLRSENGIDADKSRIIVSNGGKQAIYEFFQAVLEPGDEVLIPAPYWVSYPTMVEIAGGKAVIVQTRAEDAFKLSPQALASAITPRTKVLILNSPSNPTGVAYSAAELAEIGRAVEKSGILVLSDEVYEKLVYGDFQFVSFAKAAPFLAERTVTVNAFSKTYSMTGWRVGYASGPADIIKAMIRYQSHTTSNVCSIAQHAALAALKGPHDFLEPLRQSYQRRIAMALEAIAQMPGLRVDCIPRGAFYVFVRFDELADKCQKRRLQDSGAFAAWLLDSAGVAAVPGGAFGDESAFRISVAASDKNVSEALERISRAVNELCRA